MLTRTRPSLRKSSSTWATVPTASSSKRWSGRTGSCTPAMRRRSTSISVRSGSKTSRRSATPTRSSCARTRSSSRTPSRWESWSTSSRSSACSSSTTSSWTSTSTGGTSSSSRWTRTACTSHSPARSSRTLSAQGTRSGWPGTSGATASPVEKQATFGIALCSKCFYMEDRATGQAKVSSKGVNKRQNEMRAERFEWALEGSRDMATNRGFRIHNGAMYTYEQRKLGLSAYYDKRWVLEDGIHTEPIEYHQ